MNELRREYEQTDAIITPNIRSKRKEIYTNVLVKLD